MKYQNIALTTIWIDNGISLILKITNAVTQKMLASANLFTSTTIVSSFR